VRIQKNNFLKLLDNWKVNVIIMFMIIRTIKKHIKSCGKTRYRISQESGVSEAQLCRIMQGKTLTAETADVLLRYFGLTIVDKKQNRKARGTNGKC